jgi:hypothetical protein
VRILKGLADFPVWPGWGDTVESRAQETRLSTTPLL